MLLKLALLTVLAGCPANPSECKLPASTRGDLEAQIVVGDDTDTMKVVSDGSQVHLIGAPQGGHILLVGARIHNDDTCQLDATASLRDTATNRVIGVDQRTMYLAKTGDGWSQPEGALSAAPNVAVCPSSATTMAINGNPYQLEISIVDGDGNQVADVKATVIPTCDANDTFCTSECVGSSGT